MNNFLNYNNKIQPILQAELECYNISPKQESANNNISRLLDFRFWLWEMARGTTSSVQARLWSYMVVQLQRGRNKVVASQELTKYIATSSFWWYGPVRYEDYETLVGKQLESPFWKLALASRCGGSSPPWPSNRMVDSGAPTSMLQQSTAKETSSSSFTRLHNKTSRWWDGVGAFLLSLQWVWWSPEWGQV